ncbi:hypothetical protein AB241_03730 [Salmonella enterica]|nr:hypothetical protein [Salmonella enterica]EDR6196446.1 hypothetical protein [Salmonella enterica subsp. enterica serovar Aqua]EAX1488488.1 hypothetical protein [Salmonella enterica]EAX1577690.1 hypothetical protein [Salmonella enterica]EBP8636625.1 hypothetical protein [Salmonella enterica]
MTTNNNPANGPVSLDRLHQISEILSKASAQSDGGNLGYAMADAVKVIDGAIASFGAEPVAWVRYCSDGTIDGPLLNYQIDDCRKSTWTPLYAAPQLPQPVPVVLDDVSIFEAAIEECKKCDSIDEHAWNHGVLAVMSKYDACRAAMLQAGNPPVTQDGYVLVPKKLTAENGAKSVLSGEFSETKFINCPECFGDDDCEICDGSGRIEITVPVTWTTIKAIWAKGVEHFAAAPQQEVK